MKKRILGIFLCICMILASLPTIALAASGDFIWVAGTKLTEPGYYGMSNLNTKQDTAPTSDPKGYVHWDNTVEHPVLTLYGAEITHTDDGISCSVDYEIHLAEGTKNNVTATVGDAIRAPGRSVAIKGSGTLNATGSVAGIRAGYTISIADGAKVNIIGQSGEGIVNSANTYYDGVVIGSDCTATISGATYGIGTGLISAAPKIESSNVTITGGTAAFHNRTAPALGTGIGANASTNISGTAPEKYNSSNLSSYKWFQSYALPSYTVKYLPGANGTGSETADAKIEGSNLTLKGAIFTRDGYTQTGWATTDGGEQAYALGGTYSADAAIDLYPVWSVNKYTVTYKAEGTVVDTQTIKHGEDATAPAIPEKEGYNQTAPVWDHDGKNITADTEINAVYTPNEYTVTYKADGTVVDTQTVKHGEDAAAPAIPEKEGYNQTAPVWSHDGKNITADTEINAVYTANEYTVTYKVEGAVFSIQTIKHGEDTTAPAIPAKYGHDQTVPVWDNDGKNITGDTVINAVYTPNEYTVTYMADGVVVDVQTIKHGRDATTPDIPEKEGYDQTAPVWDNNDKNITCDTVINALYRINVYTITFMDENGVYKTLTYQHGETIAMPMAPEKDGYTVEWETTISKATGDVIINAVYTALPEEDSPLKDDPLKDEPLKDDPPIDNPLEDNSLNNSKKDNPQLNETSGNDLQKNKSQKNDSLKNDSQKDIPQTEKSTVSKTGDGNNLYSWIALLFVTGASMLEIARRNRKRKAVTKG